MSDTKTISKIMEVNGKDIEVNIDVYYDLGGINYCTGKFMERGIKISIDNDIITKNYRESTPMDEFNRIYHIKTLKRKSKKQINKIYDIIFPLAEEIMKKHIKNPYDCYEYLQLITKEL